VSRDIVAYLLTAGRPVAYHMLKGGCGVMLHSFLTRATSLGEASAENKGHGPETSRDADGQDR
jgi:hypothetical protein